VNDALAQHVRCIRQTALLQVAQCDALLQGLGELDEVAELAPGAQQAVACPKCGESRFQAQARAGEYVCGACGINHRNGEVVE